MSLRVISLGFVWIYFKDFKIKLFLLPCNSLWRGSFMPILFRGELRLVHRRSLQPRTMCDLPRRQCTVLVKSSVSRFRSEFNSQCSHLLPVWLWTNCFCSLTLRLLKGVRWWPSPHRVVRSEWVTMKCHSSLVLLRVVFSVGASLEAHTVKNLPVIEET